MGETVLEKKELEQFPCQPIPIVFLETHLTANLRSTTADKP